jgi:hypothetical protein
MEADSARQDQNVRKIHQEVTSSGSASTNPIYCGSQLLKNLNTKTSLKWKINLIRPYQEVHSYSMKSKKGTPKSRETIPSNPIAIDLHIKRSIPTNKINKKLISLKK